MQRQTVSPEFIATQAKEYAARLIMVAEHAKKEEQIRIESERQLQLIQDAAGIKLEGQHEFTVASGFVDSVYDRVLIEYKNPNSSGSRIGPALDSPGTKKVIAQIKSRFADMRAEYNQPLNSLFGVGLDGRYFVFVRFRDGEWHIQEPMLVSKYSAEKFLWALFNLGIEGKPFSPAELARDFGATSEIARLSVKALYEAITTTENPKAVVLFSQWRILFGEVCGYDVDHPSTKIEGLAEGYLIDAKGLQPASLLFALHTYYAVFMKLLASQIVSFYHQLPTPLSKMLSASDVPPENSTI